MDGRQAEDVTLPGLMGGMEAMWGEDQLNMRL